MTFDDSSLFHSNYDPAKAHAYYLKKRELKGRTAAAPQLTAPSRRQPTAAGPSGGGTPNRSNTASRHAQLEEQKANLEKRVERLKAALDELVAAAKKRSGVKPAPKSAAKDSSPATKAASNKAQKSADKPLTTKQKADKAQTAKKAYEKEHPNSLSKDVDILQAQVADIRAKIDKAVAAAEVARKKADTKTPIVRQGPGDPFAGNNSSGPKRR